jgi:glyoxylase-like metal-dependent hydrolase (beta-lactamase superfamily II)
VSEPVYSKQEQEPASDEVIEVAPGVLRMQLPISMPGLGHVNTYALEDERGFALVDPGLPGPESWTALMARLETAGIPLKRVHTTIVTHSHPDHFGETEDDIDVGFVLVVEAVEQDDHRLVDRQAEVVDLTEAHALAEGERRRADPHEAGVWGPSRHSQQDLARVGRTHCVSLSRCAVQYRPRRCR